jgi:3-hydroxyacyl-CoA dehydrogenase/enoyl-CoA hydratase/3-hydroxybutyryl-CoA epimerase
MTNAFTLSVSPEGVAELKFDLPGEKVNKFSLPVMEELEAALDSIRSNSSIKVLKLTSGKDGCFVAGADLHSFEPAFVDPSKVRPIMMNGHRTFSKLASLPFPTVAVINGSCLGGGCEYALSCTYRVATDNAKTLIGLPEVNLGIYPGWGGTQRLPRLIGFSEGLGMIIAGKIVPAYKAWKLHLVDALIPYEFQEAKVNEFVASILTKEGSKKVLKRRNEKSFFQKLLDNNPLGRALVYNRAEKQLMEKTKGHYPAPVIALKLLKETYGLPLDKGLKQEADTFIANVPQGFIQAPNFISLFFTQEALKKETGAPAGTKTTQITSAAVLGAGTMGAGIAWLFASKGVFTRLKDVSWDFVGKGIATVLGLLKKGLKAKKITPSQLDRTFQLVSGTVDYSGFQHAQLVLEAATENLELKRKIFQELEAAISDTAIIGSNTSSLSIDVMAETLKHRERFIGMHFFNPVPKMPLVEVVPGKHTSKETTATAMEFCRKLGKTPIIVGDCPGFLVNRIFLAGANEMMLMLEEGYSVEALNKASLDFGMPLGPLTLADEVGNDVTYKVSDVLEKAYGERMHSAQILHLMVDKGFLGKKVGKGFYLYNGKETKLNSEAFKLVESVGRKTSYLPEDEILPRFIYVMINEASRCLEEKIIERPDYLDMALIMGIGFPPFQGGLLRYADKVGVQNVAARLKQLEAKHGMRFAPAKLLERMAAENKPFYPPL